MLLVHRTMNIVQVPGFTSFLVAILRGNHE